MSKPLRILFMGTPEFATPSLRALAESQHQVVAVVTNPDRAAGRGNKLTPPPVKKVALSYDIPVVQPEKVRRNNELYDTLKGLEPDVAVVIAYGQILPQRFLDLPTHGCLNIHASLLPKYRGASPINAAIIDGEKTSGVTIMRMEKGLDTGPILRAFPFDIPHDMNAQGLHDALSLLGAEHIVDVVQEWCSGTLTATPQPESDSYAPIMSKDDGKLDWSQEREVIYNHIRGVYPWPGAHSTLHQPSQPPRQVKIHCAAIPKEAAQLPEKTDFNSLPVGSLIAPNLDTLLVKCGDNFLQILELQPAGKRSMQPRDFINGFQPFEDSFFS